MDNVKNRLVIAGGTGFIGDALIQYFNQYDIVVLSRKPGTSLNRDGLRYIYWDGETLGEWAAALEGAAAVINLSGKSVNCRYTEKNKALIFSSRLKSTTVIGQAINQCAQPPAVWINAGSATIYRHATDKQMDEFTGEFHDDFSVQVCKAWEKTFNEIQTPRTRKAFLRIAIVLGNGGGVFKTLRSLTRLGLGGKQGSGQQFVSWIHEKDLCRAMEFIMQKPALEGIFNCAAPNPERNKTFMQLLRKKMRMPFGIPQSGFMLRMGTWIMGTEKELVLKSRNVVPTRLLQEGFTFQFNRAGEAFDDLLRK